MALTVAGGLVLAWEPDGTRATAWGALAVAAACLCWGLDNNLTRKVSTSDAVLIACIKGLVAGTVNVSIAALTGQSWPALNVGLVAGFLGIAGYGVSLALFVIALRHLGAARTGAYFSVAPFFGAVLAVAMWNEPLSAAVAAGGVLMALGVWLHVTERHEHAHTHDALEHEHAHAHDKHHRHDHVFAWDGAEPHTHRHAHPHYVTTIRTTPTSIIGTPIEEDRGVLRDDCCKRGLPRVAANAGRSPAGLLTLSSGSSQRQPLVDSALQNIFVAEMSESQWFNRPTWTADDRRDFLRHLERVRSAIARAQYVLIQARCLFDAGLYEPALRLLSLILERYPTPPELLKARILRARCYAASGDADRAVEEFRCAVALERTSSEKSGAWIVFGLFVVEHHRSTLFSEISRIFEEFSSQLPKLETPRQRYEARLVLAALAAHHCQADQARAHARAALAAASETSSRVRNHRAPRLVGEMKSALYAALEGWAKD